MNVLTVDYRSPDRAKRFAESLRDTGFAVLTNHPITADLIYGTFADWEEFFASPSKSEYTFDPKIQSGYFPFRSENAKDSPIKDLKEFFHLYPWTKLPTTMNQRTWEMFHQLNGLASELLGWIEDETPEDIRKSFSIPLRKMIDESQQTLLRTIHYPPLKGDEEEGAIRAAAHEDINLITLLPSATAPGLEVQNLKGEWFAVPCDPGSIVINAGDMLQEASANYYRSTTHRVVNPPGDGSKKSRFSMPLFLHPRPDVQLSPRITAGAYLKQRLEELGLKT